MTSPSRAERVDKDFGRRRSRGAEDPQPEAIWLAREQRATSGGIAQKARHWCRPNTLSMADMNKLFRLKVPRKTLKAITLETGELASAWTNQHSSPSGYAWG